MLLDQDIPDPMRRELTDWLTETARTFGAIGIRMSFPDSIEASQTAWPGECPLSEQALRAQVRALLDEAQALERQKEALKERAQELYATLPERPPEEIEGDAPQSIYYAVTDALSCLIDDDYDDLGFIEKRLAATPESLRAEWLERLFAKLLTPHLDSSIHRALKQLTGTLCGDDFEAPEDAESNS